MKTSILKTDEKNDKKKIKMKEKERTGRVVINEIDFNSQEKSNPLRRIESWSSITHEENNFEFEYSDDDTWADMSRKQKLDKLIIGNAGELPSSFFRKSNLFSADIVQFSEQAKKFLSKIQGEKDNFVLFDIEADRNTFKKVKILRYRENVFRAAGRLTHDISPFPNWVYRDRADNKLDTIKFIVGGTEFETFEGTIVNIPDTKLATCIVEHSSGPVIFFDRDPDCFNSVLNFYRTGRLHAPSNACLSFFEEELEFWGINEDFMEPCCYSEYTAFKTACNTLKKFSESKDKNVRNHSSLNDSLRMHLYYSIVVGGNTITSMWYATICATCIVGAIMIMFFGTSSYGRIDVTTDKYRHRQDNESLIYYFQQTSIHKNLIWTEFILSGYFIADIVTRLILSPNPFIFFSETINWVDILATVSSFMSNVIYDKNISGHNEAYIIILKIPRIFRLFKLTTNLKNGMDAFLLTLAASVNELLLVFLIVVIFVCIFGVLIFVVELVNEVNEASKFKTIYIGIWWAIVTMTTVGYGDFYPKTQGGYLVGCACIMCGVIICQLPVPIFLHNFSIYYNQANARMDHQVRVLTESIDPENLVNVHVDEKGQKIGLCKEDLLKLKRFSTAY